MEIYSDTELTPDEDEALIDLQKEYELKKQQLMEKKKQQERGTDKFLNGLQRMAAKPVKPINLDKRIFQFDISLKLPVECDDIELFTKEPLRTKTIDMDQLLSIIKKHDIKPLNVPKLLAKVTKPDFKEPHYDNWAVIGYITEKSEILMTKNGDKYLKMKVGNFSHSVSLNLFGDAYKKHWKVYVGEMIIILNPFIYRHQHGFDLSLTEDLNNLLSIGTIKNITQCQADGCKKYINSKFKLCEFHDIQEEKKFLKNKRMELNGSIKMFNPHERALNEESRIYHAKSQFDGSKYVRDDIFQKQGSKRKLQDERARKNLEKKLLKLNVPKYEKIGLVKLKTRELQLIKQSHLNYHKQLRDEFKSLAKNKQINLGMSKQDKLAKKHKWSENIDKYSVKREKPEISNQEKIIANLKNPAPQVNAPPKYVTLSDSDDDF